MEYYRDARGQIQADMAYRLGTIASQYRNSLRPPRKDFSVTLDVCILQNLLTTCTELLKSMSGNETQIKYLTADVEKAPVWGLRREVIETNMRGQLTAKFVLTRLRNALSHPTALDINDRFPSSGYTTIPDGSHTIRRYCFVNSPDTESSGHPMSFSQRGKAERALEKARSQSDMPVDVEIIEDKLGKFCFGRGDEPFARIFKIHLTGEEIHALVIGLSNYLAQPIRKDWDGVTVTSLVA